MRKTLLSVVALGLLMPIAAASARSPQGQEHKTLDIDQPRAG